MNFVLFSFAGYFDNIHDDNSILLGNSLTIICNLLQLVVMASDQGSTQLHGFATVKIHILDVNDNAPEFLQVTINYCLV